MKISKLKALTIATTVIGSASLASIAGVTAVAVLNNQTSENQNYSQTGSGDTSSGSKDSDSNNHANSGSNDNSSENQDKLIDWAKVFPSKRVIESKAGTKAVDALTKINSINDLWNFYTKPVNIPLNYTLTLDKVTTYKDTSDSALDLLVSIKIEDDKGSSPQLVQFLIYGFSNFSSSDYKLYFENANSHGLLSKIDGKKPMYIDPRELNTDPSSSNYFANYYQPVIPEELSANNINVSPQSFSIDGKNVIFNYLLYSDNRQIQTNAKAVVYGFYDYPGFSNNQSVTSAWQPQNWEFIKANLNTDSRKDFNKFFVDHWNDSIGGDVSNAFRYWYLNDQKIGYLNDRLQQYIYDGFNAGQRDSWTIGYLMGARFSKGSNGAGISAKYIYGGPKSIQISPVYSSSSSLTNNNFNIELKWQLPNFVEGNFFNSASGYYYNSPAFTVTGTLTISFKNTKPTIDSLGNVSMPATIKVDVDNPNPQNSDTKKHVTISQNKNIDVLMPLYEYYIHCLYKLSAIYHIANPYSSSYFEMFQQALSKKV